ncbi:HotDog domain-containing protein [Cladochytrium replicatum]|nr:HotDog domain-containing protein [Cladochytrium replicatum]
MATKVDVSKAVGHSFPSEKVQYNRRDLILYALGVGVNDLRFVYELDKDFGAFPTYPLVLPLKGDSFDVTSFAERYIMGDIPGVPSIDLNKLLHGDQYIELLGELPKEATLVTKTHVSGVYDAGKGLVLERVTTMETETGTPLVKMIATSYIFGLGGFGGPKRPKPIYAVEAPKRTPDYVKVDQISPSAAILYRLSGDYNPLHVDPSIGKKMGFKGAILHGLCTFGHAAAAVMLCVAKNERRAFKSIGGRFASPVNPGDKLETRMWVLPGPTSDIVTVAFETYVVEEGAPPKLVISNGSVALWKQHSPVAGKL